MTAMLWDRLRFSHQRWSNGLLVSSALVGVGVASSGALAQTVPGGTNLYPTYTGSATSSTVWNLLGDAYVSNGTSASVAVSLPSGLTIDGAAGGSTITMNDGANHFAYFNFATDVTLNLNDVTFTGGGTSRVMEGNGHDIVLNGTGTLGFINNSGPIGGVIHTTGSVTLDASVITLANNSSSSTGGVIWSGQDITIGNADSIVTIDGNRANIGGALKTDGNPATGLGATRVDGRVIAITNNSSATFAGAIYAGGDPLGGGGTRGVVDRQC
jgi:predicted outer membrane repeat protein